MRDMTQRFYTNRYYENKEDLKGTVTLHTYEDIYGKYSGMLLPKGSEIVLSGAQADMVWRVIEDGNCTWDVVLDIHSTNMEQFKLSYVEGKTNFGVLAVNC